MNVSNHKTRITNHYVRLKEHPVFIYTLLLSWIFSIFFIIMSFAVWISAIRDGEVPLDEIKLLFVLVLVAINFALSNLYLTMLKSKAVVYSNLSLLTLFVFSLLILGEKSSDVLISLILFIPLYIQFYILNFYEKKDELFLGIRRTK